MKCVVFKVTRTVGLIITCVNLLKSEHLEEEELLFC